jgi:hypothetical protein
LIFDPEVFISYAHLDDEAGWRGHRWVTDFHRALELRVSQLLGRDAKIWRDPNLHGNEPLTGDLVERVRRAATLITIVSPRYLKSDWTLCELNEFCSGCSKQPDGNARIFKVIKTPVPRSDEIPPLPELLGYEFFKTDHAAGRPRELDDPDEKDYWIKIDDVAHDLCAQLEALTNPGGSRMASAKTVYLAETTADLAAEYASLKRDLTQHGYAVAPSRPLPLVDKELRVFVQAELSRADLSVHLVGKNYSLVPEDATKSICEIQHEIALESATQRTFRQLVWMPPTLQVHNEKQKAFVEYLRIDPQTGGSIDVLQTSFEDLRFAIHACLTTNSPGNAKAPKNGMKQLYFVFDRMDVEVIEPWRKFLFDHFEIVFPELDADETRIREVHEENLRTSDAVLILYASASEIWLRRKLREIQKAAGYGRERAYLAVAVVVAPPITASKRLFDTHDAIVISQGDGFSPRPLVPFVEKVKGAAASM